MAKPVFPFSDFFINKHESTGGIYDFALLRYALEAIPLTLEQNVITVTPPKIEFSMGLGHKSTRKMAHFPGNPEKRFPGLFLKI